MMLFGGLTALLFWLLPIILVVAAVMYFSDRSRSDKRGKNALEILDEAYARGEISREEYLQRREDLSKK
jgi:putative membrane protein